VADRKKVWFIRARLTDAPAAFEGHTHHVLALAVTTDGKYLVRCRAS
jgi:hypothetical protein